MRRALAATLAVGFAAAALGDASASTRGIAPTAPRGRAARPSPLVARGDVLVETQKGRLTTVTLAGHPVHPSPRIVAHGSWTDIELAPDRRHAFVSNLAEPRDLYELNLANGHKRLIAHGFSPALSPDQSELAYLAVGSVNGIEEVTALVIRNLRTQAVHAIPFAPPVTAGTPPEWITNWSPDGTQIALVSGEKTMLVEPATAATVGSQAPIAGSAPAFLNENALVVLANCCIGRQLLDTVDLQTGVRTPFAHLSSPTEFIRRVAPGRFLILTALRELVIVERGRTRVIARGLSSAGV
jgi:hypothetical protein